MDPLLCDQFQSLAADDIRSFLVDGSHHHPSAIDWLLYELDAITKSRAPGGIKDYTRYLNEVLCSYELSWYQEVSHYQFALITSETNSWCSKTPRRSPELVRCHCSSQAPNLQKRQYGYCSTSAITTPSSRTSSPDTAATARSRSRRR